MMTRMQNRVRAFKAKFHFMSFILVFTAEVGTATSLSNMSLSC